MNYFKKSGIQYEEDAQYFNTLITEVTTLVFISALLVNDIES